MKKVYEDATSALDGVLRDGMMLMAGGFGLCGIPENSIDAVQGDWCERSDGRFQQCRC